jgi:hypothetical protein
MGRRSRKARPAPAAYARAEERNAAVRATLHPLEPGERPAPLVVAAVVALLLGLSNVVLWAVGWEVQGQDPGAFGAFLFAVIMGCAAVGMWQGRSWAVLGFMALLALVIISAAAGLVVSSNLLAAALSLLVLGLSGWLFWKLVRVLGRLQAPRDRALGS